MNILLICDDYWHPGQVAIDGVVPLKDNFKIDTITNANDFSPDMLKKYTVVILVKCDETSQTDKTPWKTEAVQKAFVEFVENGGGLIAIHSGTVAGKNTQALDRLIGCRFLDHPDACPVTVSPVKPHPVTEGVDSFCEVDEHYRIDIIASDVDVLLTSSSSEATHTAGYVRTQGKGRVCVLTPGHNLEVWLNPQFQRLLTNTINFITQRRKDAKSKLLSAFAPLRDNSSSN